MTVPCSTHCCTERRWCLRFTHAELWEPCTKSCTTVLCFFYNCCFAIAHPRCILQLLPVAVTKTHRSCCASVHGQAAGPIVGMQSWQRPALHAIPAAPHALSSYLNAVQLFQPLKNYLQQNVTTKKMSQLGCMVRPYAAEHHCMCS